MIGISDSTTIRSFGFNIPCRRFLIRANVTRDRRLPVVDEFILRALKICEEIPIGRLATYFGFSPSEVETVTTDLKAAGLISIEGNNVRLHPSAVALFRGWDDGAPRVIDVDSRVEKLWFDLVSMNMAAPDRTRSARNLIDIRPASMARDLPATYAKKAFEENFSEYLRKIRRLKNPDRFALYSVSEAVADRFGSLVFRMEEDLVFDPEPRLLPKFASIGSDEAPRFRALSTAMLDSYRQLNWMESSAAALADFASLSGDTTITDGYGGTARFDLLNWLVMHTNQKNPHRHTILGASYLNRNSEIFAKLIESHPSSASSTAAIRKFDITWYRPGGTGWGCSPELQEAMLSIKYSMRRRFGKISIRTKLIVPSASRRDHPDRFRNLFDEGHISPPGFLSPAVEVLHISDIGSLILVNVALSANVEIPVGFASTAAEPLLRIADNLMHIDARFEEIWNKSGAQDDESLPAVSEAHEAADEI